ncbi:heme exporter protein C [Litorimonas taeanensis]|uniref:Heme exporter protein C n=1 Tax=Litorimonas taeanensis TaxID=568099 RepID=A0A420WJK0_9PROT|nr:heme ABC transporter permease CcmC [Litorimonas taeanensis]RKQ71085.1 heme exporter protein C [Litorimonas taeanensis]
MISYMANPARFARVSKWLTPLLGGLAALCITIATYLGLFSSPAAELHGEGVRMMYVHVPAAWCALFAYTALAVASLVSFVWRHSLADSAAKSFAVPGLVFTILALITGSLWGRPAWGTWWQWDGRMTSVLILAFIYTGYLLLWATIEDRRRAARLASIVAMVGFINIPIIKFSVEWWNTLHQPASVSQPGAPGMAQEFLIPLLVMSIGYMALLGWCALRGIEGDLAKLKNKRRPVSQAATITIKES